VMTAVEERTYVVPSRITLREFLLREWLPAIKGTVRPTTYASYTMHVEGHIVPALGSLQVSRLSAQSINAFYAQLLKDGRASGRGGLSPATVRRIHATLHRALKDAVRWSRLPVNPVDAADPPRGKAKQRDLPAWSGQQLASFLTHLKDDRMFAFWRLLAMTGCRRGEALGLRWDDLDVEAATITIRRALVPLGAEVILSEPKTNRGRRTIALDPVTLEALKAHAARQADEQSACDTWSETGYIFTSEAGQPLDPHRTSKAFERHLRQAALPRIPLHGLRHTYATLALSSGVNPRIVSGRLGHSTVALTLDIYSHVLPQADQEAADRIAALIEL
jgi:integrase